MKNKIIISLLLVSIIFLSVPTITMAAWWNPLSWSWNPLTWFHKTTIMQPVQKTQQPVKPVEIQTQTPANTQVSNTISQPSVKSLKNENPQQFNNLVSPNKSQLLEASKTLSNKNIIAKVKPAVVYIETSDGSSGSGMIIESNGYILTNAHVVTGFNSATIKLTDGRSFNGNVVGRDENMDFALLKINANQLSTVVLGDSDSVEQGDPVFTFGYPLGIEGDVDFKDGTLSRRQNINGTTYLEISAQILPGNSGGPLVNQNGEVIGINNMAIIGKGETLKFALPINLAKGLIPDLKSGRNVVLPKTTTPNLPSLPPLPQNPAPAPIPTPTPQPTPAPTPQPIKTIISNIKATENSDGIVVSWDTNKSFASSKVLYGINSDLSGTEAITTPLRSLTIRNLKPATTYFYQIVVKDTDTGIHSDPEEAKSDVLSFVTKKVKPSIISVDVSYPSSTTAVILVKADIESYSNLQYRKSGDTAYENCYGPAISGFTSCDSITGGSDKKTEHSFTITHLNPEINYEYSIRVDNTVILSSQNNYSDSRTGSFKSPVTP